MNRRRTQLSGFTYAVILRGAPLFITIFIYHRGTLARFQTECDLLPAAHKTVYTFYLECYPPPMSRLSQAFLTCILLTVVW